MRLKAVEGISSKNFKVFVESESFSVQMTVTKEGARYEVNGRQVDAAEWLKLVEKAYAEQSEAKITNYSTINKVMEIEGE